MSMASTFSDFLTDGVDGYLFGDLDNDGWIDSGMELLDLGILSDFRYSDII